MKNIKNFVFIGLLIFLFVEVLIVFPSKLEHEDDKALRARIEAEVRRREQNLADGKGEVEPTSTVAEQRMGGVHLVESQQGLRDWELFANSAEGSQSAGTWKLHQVRVLFYNKEKVEFTVTGDQGSIDAKSKDLSIIGNVTTKSENGYSFMTPSVYYSSLKRIIQSPEQVTMKGPRDSSGEGLVLKGRSMQVLVDESKMIIKENVTAQKPMKEGKTFDVAADGAEFSGKSKEARFLGKVRMTYDNMRLEGPEASFLYDSGASILSSVAVKGGVKVSDADKFATAQTVNLDLLANKYVFKGSPRIIQNNDELTGEEIIFLEGGKKVKIERVRAKMENKKR
ncbi:LPS export ABC transporter periplasmic protein LptC [Bdellovibrio svalbardensis]|uniref:LPS export ABC transporter periplasmic protein LptC n=1 Tax=Bdellovibrio svalbardensis TaxID=2972972 RepID=A0ABT6DLG7_9BACT|nr:LPS export ABC transporter periplasmic protein LptC [Bdellovibrio svalbardensis]MDG0816754.1 LPS export ABC transporter periplasmic protein LptC [Bdellovibrio svalbardensis]